MIKVLEFMDVLNSTAIVKFRIIALVVCEAPIITSIKGRS